MSTVANKPGVVGLKAKVETKPLAIFIEVTTINGAPGSIAE